MANAWDAFERAGAKERYGSNNFMVNKPVLPARK